MLLVGLLVSWMMMMTTTMMMLTAGLSGVDEDHHGQYQFQFEMHLYDGRSLPRLMQLEGGTGMPS